MSEQPLNLRTSLSALRRGRYIVGGAALVGLAAGVGHSVFMPPPPVASALVILAPVATSTSTGATVDDPSTQVIIATSTPVLAAAGAAVSPPISAAQLKHEVVVKALSTEVLQFRVDAPRAKEAETLANALVAGYISYNDKAGTDAADSAIPALQQEAAQLSAQIRSLQLQINTATARLARESATSTAGQRDSSLLSSLRTEQEEVSLQLNNVNSQIVSTQLSSTLSAGATHVLQPATMLPVPMVDRVLGPAIGALAGLLLGCLLSLLRYRRDHRLRMRDEMAAAIGVPVFASFECEPCKSVKDWAQLLSRYRPSPIDAWNLRRLLHQLAAVDTERPSQVNILALAGDGPALAVGVKLAKSAAVLGMPVALVPGDHPSLALLRAACTFPLAGTGNQDDQFVFEATDSGHDPASVRLTLSLVAVDEAKPEPPASKGTNLLAVTAGFATPEALARVALAVSDVGPPLEGIVVVNPDPGDGTVGSTPVGGRARPVSPYGAQRVGAGPVLGQPR